MRLPQKTWNPECRHVESMAIISFLSKDILAQMEFRPVIRKIEPMDKRLFTEPHMEIRSEFLLDDCHEQKYYPSNISSWPEGL